MEKVADATILLPYGMASRPIPGDTLALVLSIQGQEENRIAIPLSTTNRKKGLKDGETVLENEETGGFCYLREDGTLEVFIPKDLETTVKKIIINASEEITVSAGGAVSLTTPGTASISASGVTVDAATTELTGSLEVGGAFGANGQPPQAPYPVDPPAVGLLDVIALANQLRAALIANGIAI
jgi:phage gp45-like